MMAGEIGAVDDAIDWLYVGVVGAGFLVATVGVTAIRKRGEPLLAVAVLAFSLVLPTLYVLFFLLLAPLFPDGAAD